MTNVKSVTIRLTLKVEVVGDKTTLSGKEFQLLITLSEKV